MPTDHRSALARIKRFDQLIAYLRDEMGWPIARDSFDDVDDLFYDFTADELGIDPKTAAKIQEHQAPAAARHHANPGASSSSSSSRSACRWWRFAASSAR